MRNIIINAAFLLALATVALSPSVAGADDATSGLPRLEVSKEYKLPPNKAYPDLIGGALFGDAPTAVAWSPDGKELAAFSSYGQNLTVWNVNGDVVKVLHPIISYLHNSLAFLNDDELLAQSENTRVVPANAHLAFDIWNIPKGAVTRRIDGPEPTKDWGANTPEAYTLSPDGSMAVMLAQETGTPEMGPEHIYKENPVPVYSTKTWDVIQRIPIVHPLSVAFSSDGNQVAFGDVYGKVVIYDVVTWKLLNTITACEGKWAAIETLAYSPSGVFIVAGMTANGPGVPPCAVSVFRVADGAKVGAYPENEIGGPWKVLWHSSGKFIVIAPHGRTIRIWNPAKPYDSGKTILDVNPMCLAFSPDGKHLAACNEGRITVFNINF